MENSEVLDIGIVFVQLPVEGRGAYWDLRGSGDAIGISLAKQILGVQVEEAVCRDSLAFLEKVVLRGRSLEVSEEERDFPIPVEMDDQLSECCPQFSLRNIPKVERYHDLSRPLVFDVADMPRDEAESMLETVRNARIGEIELVKFTSSELLSDFRVFLEEILFLAPWDQISRGRPEEGSLWDIKHSNAKLSHDLISRQSRLFIYGLNKTHEISSEHVQLRHGNVEQKKSRDEEDWRKMNPFGESFGPPD